jgi:hypothetical protein
LFARRNAKIAHPAYNPTREQRPVVPHVALPRNVPRRRSAMVLFQVGACGVGAPFVCVHDSLAEWSKALASGASPQGRGFEPHSCHLARSLASRGLLRSSLKALQRVPDAYAHRCHGLRNCRTSETWKPTAVMFGTPPRPWCPVVSSRAQWCPVVPSGAKWYPVVPSGA